MNWIHIYGNDDLTKSFGVNAFAATFFINKEGIIIFNKDAGNQNKLVALLNKCRLFNL